MREKSTLRSKIEGYEHELAQLEEKRKNSALSDIIYKNNILLYSLKEEKSILVVEIKNRESTMDNKDKISGILCFNKKRKKLSHQK